jgi:hypothetical protein
MAKSTLIPNQKHTRNPLLPFCTLPIPIALPAGGADKKISRLWIRKRGADFGSPFLL